MADLVVFGEDWKKSPCSTHHLVSQLLKNHRVIWVNTSEFRIPRRPLVNIIRFLRSFNKLRTTHSFHDMESPDSPLYILQPGLLPFSQFKSIRAVNNMRLVKIVQEAIKNLGFQDIILWTSQPSIVDCIGQLDEKVTMYYYGEESELLDGKSHYKNPSENRKLVSLVDLVVVSNEELATESHNKNTVILPQGVDFDLFSSPSTQSIPMIGKSPVAGYYGNLSNRLDVEMLAQSATALPNWQFIFIGKISTDVEFLFELPNVSFLGNVAYEQLPTYVQSWDVALLPFKQETLNPACNPLQLKEYLASGTAIASTSFPSAKLYADIIAVQKSKEPFFQVILRAYKQANNSGGRQERIASDTWQNRSFQVESLISHFLKKQSVRSK